MKACHHWDSISGNNKELGTEKTKTKQNKTKNPNKQTNKQTPQQTNKIETLKKLICINSTDLSLFYLVFIDQPTLLKCAL